MSAPAVTVRSIKQTIAPKSGEYADVKSRNTRPAPAVAISIYVSATTVKCTAAHLRTGIASLAWMFPIVKHLNPLDLQTETQFEAVPTLVSGRKKSACASDTLRPAPKFSLPYRIPALREHLMITCASHAALDVSCRRVNPFYAYGLPRSIR
jgi:hypothetical protein